ncbi:MAG: HlyD family efflux transporter periplasmic adaptor subunit [bacterium]|nr:HlyD family efflux transporter periplasmic adaptor subunit [bacterium]
MSPVMPNNRGIRQFIVWILFVLVLAAVAFFFEFTQTTSCQAVIRPLRQWTLVEKDSGALLASYNNILTGHTFQYDLYHFDRTNFLTLDFPILRQTNSGNSPVPFCQKGDVLVQLKSTILEEKRAELNTRLAQAEATFEALSLGGKVPSIAQARLEIKKAETALSTFEVIYNRQKELFEEEIVSEGDLDELESEYQLLKLDVALAKANLDVLTSGADPGAFLEAERLIPNLRAELEIVDRMIAQQTVRSPLKGKVSTHADDPAILLSVAPTDTLAISLFIPGVQNDWPVKGMKYQVTFLGSGVSEIEGQIVEIHPGPVVTEQGVFVAAVGLSLNEGNHLKVGMRGSAILIRKPTTFWEILKNSLIKSLQQELPSVKNPNTL